MQNNRKQYGFTIVELLIVIVVIAILAAITIVAYNGFQQRAENQKTASAVAAYVKAFSLYAADNGQYPSTAVYPCLGIYTPDECAEVTHGTPGCLSYGTASSNTAFNTAIAQYLNGQKPQPSTQRISCSGDVFLGAYVNTNSSDPKNLSLVYFLRGNATCPSIHSTTNGVPVSLQEGVMCSIAMPALP